jgi:putative PIN family toxin of toxin-antitoxin system
MRVTCDANLLVRAALHSRGLAREILQHSTLSPHVLVVSPPLLGDVHRVLHYPRIQQRYALPDQDIDDFIAFVQAVSDVVVQPNIVRVVPGDADDDVIIATAVDGKADVICTLDQHFSNPAVLTYCVSRSIRIMTDVELVQELRRNTP